MRTWLSPLVGYDPASGIKPCLPSGFDGERLCEALAQAEAEGVASPPGCLSSVGGDDLPTLEEKTIANGEKGSFAVIGAGNYARTQTAYHLLHGGLACGWVVDRDPVCAALVKKALSAARASTAPMGAVEDPGTGLLVVTTFHETHAPLSVIGLRAGKRVFVEKPPATTRDQLAELHAVCAQSPQRWRVGYNRRYAPLTLAALAALDRDDGPTTVVCTVREASIPRGHWYYWPNQGTRITGNLCHWIDLAFLLCRKRDPVTLCVTAPVVDGRRDEETCIVIEFEDGSQATIIGTGRGDGTLGVQERVEARRGGSTFVIEDYRSAYWRRGGAVVKRWWGLRDRGHRAMFRSCARWAQGNTSQEPVDYTLQDLWIPTLMTIMASEMAVSGETSRRISAGELAQLRGPRTG